jgi:SAM-dependent methyltransferase
MDNRKFWNERYNSLPSLGSGPGSRAYAAWIKRRLIADYVAARGVCSILDLGCGDMYWMAEVPMGGVTYTGVDISDVIVERNRARLPQFEFLLHDFAAAPLGRSADLVLCFDVLIHQLAPEQFRATLRNVLASVGNIALISYLTANASAGSPLPETPHDIRQDEDALLQFLHSAAFPRAETAFHGDLALEIGQLMPHADVRIVGSYPYQTIYEVTPAKQREG